jgi:potassium-transporting ATPase KdpC subunit
MKTVIQSLRMNLVFILILGFIYPVIVTLAGQALFKEKAEGSFITRDGKTIGSRLIAQKFESAKYFHPRPSAIDYNPLPSGGSNLGPTSKKLQDSVVQARTNLGSSAPKEMLYASASGLDPHLSPEGAAFQVSRVAQARGFDPQKTAQLEQLVRSMTRGRDLGFLAEPVVNVLELNLALDQM